MKIYLIRHGDPDYARDSLTPRGVLEAKALAVRMAGLKPTHLFASPLGRAQATARYTAEALGMEVTTLPWTRELKLPCRRPQVPGQYSWDVHGESIRSRNWFSRLTGWGRWRSFPRVMEAPEIRDIAAQVAREGDAFLAKQGYERDRGYYRVVRPNRHRLAIFCHGGFGLTWLAHLLDLPLSAVYASFTLTTTSVTTILFDERTPGRAAPRVLAMADTSHLFAAGLDISPAGIKANLD